jgi:hypothetical protein
MKNKFVKKLFKKFTEKEQYSVLYGMALILIISSMGLMIYATTLYYVGYHAVDLSVNGMYIENTFNASLVDRNSNFEDVPLEDVYISGHNQMRASFYLMLIGAFIFGYYLVCLVMYVGNLGRLEKR